MITRTKLLSHSGYPLSRVAPLGGGGGYHVKVTGVIVDLLGVKIRGSVPLTVLKSKMTSVRSMVVPYRVLSRKI